MELYDICETGGETQVTLLESEGPPHNYAFFAEVGDDQLVQRHLLAEGAGGSFRGRFAVGQAMGTGNS